MFTFKTKNTTKEYPPTFSVNRTEFIQKPKFALDQEVYLVWFSDESSTKVVDQISRFSIQKIALDKKGFTYAVRDGDSSLYTEDRLYTLEEIIALLNCQGQKKEEAA